MLTQRIAVISMGIALCLSASTTFADSISVGAAQDNTLYADVGVDLSNGAGQNMFAGNNGGGIERRALIQFDLSAIPQGSRIDNVTLTLFMGQSSAGDLDINLHRLLAGWGESTSDANGGEGGGIAAEVGDATWNHTFFPGSFWNTAGGDFDSTASATQVVGGVGFYQWSSSGLISDVQSWIDGSDENHGWLILGDNTGLSTAKRFNTRENNANNPLLTIEFTTVPEPNSAIVLFAMGGRLIRRRRS